MSERINDKCCATCAHLETRRTIDKTLGAYFVHVHSSSKCLKTGKRIDIVGCSGCRHYEIWSECYRKIKEQEEEKRLKEDKKRLEQERLQAHMNEQHSHASNVKFSGEETKHAATPYAFLPKASIQMIMNMTNRNHLSIWTTRQKTKESYLLRFM